jgi:thiosulfate/3-mercaptopyruvate sulfurtransferase
MRLTLAGLGAVTALLLAATGYGHPEMLVDTSWVALHGSDPDVRLVDVRSAAAYAEGHIPGAVRVEEQPLRNAEDRLTYLPRPEAFAQLMGAAGIANTSHVVVYDDQGGRAAARLWYVLNAYGHERVSLVNGGWGQWVAEKRPTGTEVPRVTPAQFIPKATPSLTCPSTAVLQRKPGVVVLDTRTAGEYAGARPSPGAKRAGHIPGAVNVDWQENVTGPTLVFKPAEELMKLYASKGVTPDKEIVTHCASGGRAAQSLFTLKLLGFPNVRIYYGSFSDYTSRPEAPVEK